MLIGYQSMACPICSDPLVILVVPQITLRRLIDGGGVVFLQLTASGQLISCVALMSITPADDVGAGNYDDIRGCHNPKGVFADYWDIDEDPHNRNQSQQDG